MWSKKIQQRDKELATQICELISLHAFDELIEHIPSNFIIEDYPDKSELVEEIKFKISSQEANLYFTTGFCNNCYLLDRSKKADIICFKSYFSTEIILSLAFIKSKNKKSYIGLKICIKPANSKEELDVNNADNPFDW
jgi:hypothetical protein